MHDSDTDLSITLSSSIDRNATNHRDTLSFLEDEASTYKLHELIYTTKTILD